MDRIKISAHDPKPILFASIVFSERELSNYALNLRRIEKLFREAYEVPSVLPALRVTERAGDKMTCIHDLAT